MPANAFILTLFGVTLLGLGNGYPCTFGCVSCDTENNSCRLCDYQSNMYMKNDKCVEISIPNCDLISFLGECLMCESGYYLDATDRCVKVPANAEIANCQIYTLALTCAYCNSGYYLEKKNCMAVNRVIEGCEIYADASSCTTCGQGKVPSGDGSRCIQAKETNACVSYSYIDCLECQQDYVLNRNLHLTDKRSALVFRKKGRIGQMETVPVCEPAVVANCDEYFSVNYCSKCSEGFFLDRQDGQCKPYPVSFVKNCKVFGGPGKCVDCMKGYRLTSDGGCLPVAFVDKCLSYNTAYALDFCELCQDGYYSSQGTECKLRQNSASILHCQVYHPQLDLCKACYNSFILAPNGLFCYPQIQFCEVYDQLDLNNPGAPPGCQKCLPSFYLSNGECAFGTVKNCEIFERNSNTCVQCLNGFYLNSFKYCIRHANITNCLTYSSNQPNSCEVCANNTMPFRVESGCLPVTSNLPNCVYYDSDFRCAVCKQEFYVTTDGQCSRIPVEFPACLEFDFHNKKCLKCHHQFKLYNGECSKILDYQKSNSEFSLTNYTRKSTEEATDTELRLLVTCVKGTIPIPVSHTFQCVNSAQLSLFDGRAIRHCRKYADGVCVQCESGYFVSESGNSCYEECNGLILLDQVTFINSIAYHIGKKRCMDSRTLPNCQYASYNNKQQISCVGCKSQYQKIIDTLTGEYVFYETDKSEARLVSPVNKFPVFSCEVSSKIVENCDYYRRYGDKAGHFCIGCVDGFVGMLDPLVGATSMSCAKVRFCGEKQVGNLPPILNIYYSCHYCSDEEKIVVIGVTGGDESEWGSEQLAELPNRSGQTLDCVNPKSINLIANCLLAAYDHDKQAYFCTACKPNFDAVRSADSKYIKACNPIANCDPDGEKTLVNGCVSCLTKTHLSDDNGNVAYSFCMPVEVPNCYAATIDGVCLYCEPGYYTNADGNCERFSIANCADSNPQATVFPSRDYLLAMHHYGEIGCNKCNGDFVSVFIETEEVVCIPSAAALSRDTPDANTAFIIGCDVYKKSLPLACAECSSGLLLTSDDKACVEALPDCVVVYSVNHKICAQCANGFVEVDGDCIKKDIPNCKVYQNTFNLTSSSCLKCNDGYYLANPRECIKGAVNDCVEYMKGSGTKCAKCAVGFVEVVIAGGVSYCFPVPNNLGCERWDEERLRNGALSCLKCQPNKFKIDAPNSLLLGSTCVLVNKESTCTSYDIKETFATSFFTCKDSCIDNDNYYIGEDFKCTQRSNIDENCLKYDPFGDNCLICINGYFALPDSTCTPMWEEIEGCADYVSVNDCSRCFHNFYLENGRCVLVKTQIRDCVEYGSGGRCVRCIHTHYLDAQSNKCVKSLAKNCAVAGNLVSCAKCHEGWGLAREGFEVSCRLVQLFECEEHTLLAPFLCLKCTPGFYPDDKGECQTVTDPIPGCKYYMNENTCMECMSDYALSVTQDSCVGGPVVKRMIDPNCNTSVVMQEPLCVKCSNGYFLFHGKCVNCLDYVQNCDVCNPVFPTKCLVCARGFYQNILGECSFPKN